MRVHFFVLCCILSPSELSAQQLKRHLQINFAQDSYEIVPTFGNNKQVLDELASLLNSMTANSASSLSKIDINSFTSPEPGVSYNKKLSQRRSDAVRQYILNGWDIPDSLLTAHGRGIAWDLLRDMVQQSEMKYRDQVLYILDNTPKETWRRVNPNDRWMTLVDSRLKQLMDLAGGRAYKYMYEEFFPKMRYGSQIIIHNPLHPPVLACEVIPEPLELSVSPIYTPEPVPSTPLKKRVVVAIKSNLLYDLCLTPGLELEVPIKNNYSINAEFYRGWWLKKHTFCWQLETFGAEGRYWFGRDRDYTDRLKGWFVGGFVSGGFYDFQFQKANGIQGDFYFVVGVSGGYGYSLNDNFGLEFSAGVGYMINEYQRYWVENNTTLIEDGSRMRMQTIFPAKLKVSLVWKINAAHKRGGVLW